MRIATVLGALVILMTATTACETRIAFGNGTAGATLINPTWLPQDLDLAYAASEELTPGGQSRAIFIPWMYRDLAGPIRFELVVNGNSVLLESVDHFAATEGELTVISIDAALAVHNPLLEEVDGDY